MLVLYLSLLDGEDEGKFERLYYKYRRLMFTCAKEILKDDVLAEDAVHEAFLRLTKHMKGIDEVKCNKTLRFVVIVVESAAKDIYRKKKRFRHVPWEEAETQYSFPVQEITESLTDVEKAILKLPLTYRQIFQMKFAWGYPNKEIAEVLNIREGTLRQRISRGKEILRNLLEEMEVYVDE